MVNSLFTLDRRGLLAGGLAGVVAGLGRAAVAARRSLALDDGWRFHLGHATDSARDFGFGAYQQSFAKPGFNLSPAATAGFDDGGWQMVRLPHDWAVELPYAPPAAVPHGDEDRAAGHGMRAIGRDFPQNSIGWYRIKLPITAQDQGRAIWLEFDGVFRNSMVMVNGYLAGGSASGYAPFGVDIGDFLNYDGSPNQLTLRVDASLGEGWFYEGAGIYRNVRLVIAHPLHVPQWGVWVRATPHGGGAEIEVTTQLQGTLRHSVIGPDGRVAAQRDGDGRIEVDRARLWSVSDPALYRLRTQVLLDGAVVDEVESSFGIRSIRFDAQQGFFLNGAPLKLLGVCNHQDHAGVGTAIPDALHGWRVGRMREMGANAWRSAHNPPAEALLDACDRAGMMMLAETRMNSSSPEGFDELDRMILSARNHPCVILWSVGNEEGHEDTPRGKLISARLVARVRELDPTRPTTQAIDRGWYADGAARSVDVVGFNYRTDQIAAFHSKFPDVPVIGTETGSTVATRGAYANDAARHILRAYDTEHPWWAANAEQWWPIVADSRFIAGGFIWTGFDYRGEPTPFPSWPSVSSYFGVADLCGFAKDNFYYYQAWWRPERPMVHLLPHWNWQRAGQMIEVWVHGNAASVELLLNGRSLGRQVMPRNLHLTWQVPYTPGVLLARGYDEAGTLVAEDRRVTAGEPAALRLSVDGGGVAVIAASVVDAAGNPVPTAANRISFSCSGPGRILGSGNGDPTDHDPDHAPSRRAFNGLAQLLVQSTGRVSVTADSPGLASAEITFSA